MSQRESAKMLPQVCERTSCSEPAARLMCSAARCTPAMSRACLVRAATAHHSN